MMGNSKRKIVVRSTITGAAAVATLLAYNSLAAEPANGGAVYHATLSELNNSGASGEASLRLQGRTLHVHITATGLEPGGVHVSHIHGLSNGNAPVDSTCPTARQDIDGDNYVELAEGQTTYGPILIDFMNIDPDQDGTVDFTTTVQLSGNEPAIPLNKRHIVVHGMSVPAGAGAGSDGPAPNEVDGTGGYKVVLPVLCGEITNAAKGRNPMQFQNAPGH